MLTQPETAHGGGYWCKRGRTRGNACGCVCDTCRNGFRRAADYEDGKCGEPLIARKNAVNTDGASQ